MGLDLVAASHRVSLNDRFFQVVLPLADPGGGLAMLWDRFYDDPVLRDPARLAEEVGRIRLRYAAERGEALAIERRVTATGTVRARILERLLQGDEVLELLDHLQDVCAAAVGSGEPVRGLSD